MRGAVRRRPVLRAGAVGVLTVAQAFVLFSAVMWWSSGSSGTTPATVAPMTWTGVVYEVGTAGVNMRANPAVADDNARDVAARGARLALQCGQTGAVVTREDGTKTATWLRTTDGLYVSMLYVHVPDRTAIPSCPGSPSDGPLLALSDPTASEEPPPPNSQLTDEGSPTTAAPRSRQASSKDTTESTAEDTPETSDAATAATPDDGVAIASGVGTATTTAPTPTTSTTASNRTLGRGRAVYHGPAGNRDVTPVG